MRENTKKVCCVLILKKEFETGVATLVRDQITSPFLGLISRLWAEGCTFGIFQLPSLVWNF